MSHQTYKSILHQSGAILALFLSTNTLLLSSKHHVFLGNDKVVYADEDKTKQTMIMNTKKNSPPIIVYDYLITGFGKSGNLTLREILLKLSSLTTNDDEDKEKNTKGTKEKKKKILVVDPVFRNSPVKLSSIGSGVLSTEEKKKVGKFLFEVCQWFYPYFRILRYLYVWGLPPSVISWMLL